MKILMVYAQTYPHIGGLSTHMELMGRGLRELGHQVDYLSMSSLSRFTQLMLFRGPMAFLKRLRRGLGEVYFLYMSRMLFAFVIKGKLRHERYDAIDAHHISSGISAHKAARGTGIPVVLTVHTYYTAEMVSAGVMRKDSRMAAIGLRNEKMALALADRIITVDSRLKQHVLSFGIQEDKVTVILNPVDTATFAPRTRAAGARAAYDIPEDRLVVLCPRRLTEKNGVLYPILAAPHLKNMTGGFMFVYAGDGELRGKMEAAISEHGLKDNFRLLGFVDHSKMSELYNLSDIVVIPSASVEGLQEASSISALEAMASGTPVVASDIGGLRDIIRNGVDGILVPEKDPEALARAISKLASDKALYDGISKNAVEHVEKEFSYISRAEQLAKVVAEAHSYSKK
jgi:glycogen(starch) synthase